MYILNVPKHSKSEYNLTCRKTRLGRWISFIILRINDRYVKNCDLHTIPTNEPNFLSRNHPKSGAGATERCRQARTPQITRLRWRKPQNEKWMNKVTFPFGAAIAATSPIWLPMKSREWNMPEHTSATLGRAGPGRRSGSWNRQRAREI